MPPYLSLADLPTSVGPEAIRLLAGHRCLELHRVEWVAAYLATDGLRLLSTYRAIDAESVRFAMRQQGLTTARVWPLSSYEAGVAAGEDCLVLELSFDPSRQPQPLDTVRAAVEAALRAQHLPLFQTMTVSTESRLLFLIEGHDEAAVRNCLRSAWLDAARVWRARGVAPKPRQLFEGLTPTYTHRAAPSGDGEDVEATAEHLDAVIVGAGVAGLYSLYKLRSLGLSVRAYERAQEVGGVWYSNNYPGARIDSESYTYAFSFSDELVGEWQWSELFAAQPEILRYLRYVADRFDLRRDIRFRTQVRAASFDARTQRWRVETDHGEVVAARYLIAAPGTLSVPKLPNYPGRADFVGESYHTACWPAQGVELGGKRVAVFGTGASGVQVIQTIAPEVAHLTVFQRSPTYCLPQRNAVLDETQRRQIKQEWTQILDKCRASYGGFVHDFLPQSGLALTPEEREAQFENLWQTPGLAFWLGNFADLAMEEEVNRHASDFLRRKIGERVRDPRIARKLMPNHPFGTKRVPLENGYYETFNRDNVELVDLRETPVERFTTSGVRTVNAEHIFDVLIYATGFEAVTGAFTRIDIRGRGQQTLAERWDQEVATALGLQVHGFPNLFLVSGPHNAATLCNAVRCIESNVDWIARCIQFLRSHDLTYIEPTAEAERQWTTHVRQATEATLLRDVSDSWFFAADRSGPRNIMIYVPGGRAYREHIEAIERAGYPGFVLA